MRGAAGRQIRAALGGILPVMATGAERKRRWREQHGDHELAAARARYAQRQSEKRKAARDAYLQRLADRAAGRLPDPWLRQPPAA